MIKLEDVIDPEARQVPKQVIEQTLEYLETTLPKGAKVLLLSHCGARAFGWGTKQNDYDIHGVIACKGYFDYIHAGYTHVDLNLHELYHLIEIALRYHSGETIINLATPVHVELLDIKQISQIVSKEFFPLYSIKSELKEGLETNYERPLLHGFRKALAPSYFFETGEWNTYLPDLWRYYQLPEQVLAELIQAYKSRLKGEPRKLPEKTQLEETINKAVKIAEENIEKKAPKFDWDKFQELREQLYTIHDKVKCRVKPPETVLKTLDNVRKRRFRM